MSVGNSKMGWGGDSRGPAFACLGEAVDIKHLRHTRNPTTRSDWPKHWEWHDLTFQFSMHENQMILRGSIYPEELELFLP